MQQVTDKYFKSELWATENLSYVAPHFRMEKAARIIAKIAGNKERDLLDIGCGPATLMQCIGSNVHYYGIDIAIHNPAPNLLQADFLEGPIRFGDKRFDIIIAQGVFEYVGRFQSQKLAEVKELLNEGGTFIASYVNFNHLNRNIYWLYNNIQPLREFRNSICSVFRVDRCFPTSHQWRHREPTHPVMKAIHMHMNANIPVISSLFAIEYFFICSSRDSAP
jgi:SAM-dependent methyltransferase